MANAPVESTAPPKNEGPATAQVPLCIYCESLPQMICDTVEVFVGDAEGWRKLPSCGKYRHFCSSNCAKDDPDQYLHTTMRDCGHCGVGQNEQTFDGDIDDGCTDEGHDY
jgi:hypothetical protein